METTKKLDEIECPKCGTPIPVSEALRHQLTQHVREELEEKIGSREKEILIKEKELKDKEKQLSEVEEEVEKRVAKEVDSAVALREADLKKKESDIALEKKGMEKRIQEELELERYAHQEKVRTSFTLKNWIFDIDQYPKMPAYMEIEGHSEEHIQEALFYRCLDQGMERNRV